MAKYFVGEVEYQPEDLIGIAKCHGLNPDADGVYTLIDAIKYMRDHSLGLRIDENLMEPSKNLPAISSKEIDANTKIINNFRSKPGGITDRNDIMDIVLNNSVYRVETEKIIKTFCWDIQIFGVSICTSCPLRNKKECDGKEIIDAVEDKYTYIPLARKIADKPKRDYKNDGKEILN